MVRLLLFVFFAFALSCTIIEDSDITSAEELAALKLNGFEIKQETQQGSSTIVLSLLYDSVINVTDDITGAKITRRQLFNLPSLSNRLSLRSGITGNTEFSISYTERGWPYTVAVYKGDLIVELYRFRYNNYTSSGTLNKIVTIIDPDGFLVGNDPTIHSKDSVMVYDTNGNLTSITRYSTTGHEGAFAMSYSGDIIESVNFNGTNYRRNQNNQGNNNWSGICDELSCSANYYIDGQAGFGIGIRYINRVENSNFGFTQIEYSCCGVEASNYYFHPLLLIHDQFDIGGPLLLIYMKDWWIPGAQNNNVQGNTRELVNILSMYGL